MQITTGFICFSRFRLSLDMYTYLIYNRHMERISLFLTEKQIERLKRLSEESGLPVAELIRRAVDEYLDKVSQKRDDRP